MIFKLFFGFFKIGLLGYGGGPATLPLIKKEYIEKYKLLTEEEFMELIGICNMLPGPILTKMAGVIGYKNGGIIGSIVAILGLLIPSTFMLILILIFFYESISKNKNIEMMVNAIIPVVTVMMGNLMVNFFNNAKRRFEVKTLGLLILGIIFILYVLNINAVFVITGVIILSVLVPKTKREEEK